MYIDCFGGIRMKLVKFGIQGFRGFDNKLQELNVDNFTCLIGKNDAGKSSVFDAMNIFFNGYKKIDEDDFHINKDGQKTEEIKLVGTFATEDNPIELETVPTSLEEEGLINQEGQLEISQHITAASKNGVKEYLVAFLPDIADVKDIHSLKNTELKERFKQIKLKEKIQTWENVPQTTNTSMRKAIINYYKGSSSNVTVEIPINKGEGKNLWEPIRKNLPVFQLFKTDRDNSDSDSEIQDPLKAITKKTLQGELQDQLNKITSRIKEKTAKQASLTLEKLNEMDPDLAEQITPKLNEPSWQNVFKFSLATDQIPLNKRGSGTRRLILLNFFRAEAEQVQEDSDSNNMIYAFEEPETAQHIDHQRMLMDSFKKISVKEGQQVLITTHSAELAGLVNRENIREIEQYNHISGIDNNPKLLHISDELGIFPNIAGLPGKVRMVIFVEGPNDVNFIRAFLDEYCSEAFTKNDVIILPFGGGTLKYWIELKMLDSVCPFTYYIFDNDSAGKSYERKIPGNALHHLWKLGPVEFYFPYEAYKSEVNLINGSRKQNSADKGNLLTLLSEEEYHHANYECDIKPVKNGLWSKFNSLKSNNELVNYWRHDGTINREFQDLAEELVNCYLSI